LECSWPGNFGAYNKASLFENPRSQKFYVPPPPPIPHPSSPVPSHANENSNSACFTVVHLPLLLANIKATEVHRIAENHFGYM